MLDALQRCLESERRQAKQERLSSAVSKDDLPSGARRSKVGFRATLRTSALMSALPTAAVVTGPGCSCLLTIPRGPAGSAAAGICK